MKKTIQGIIATIALSTAAAHAQNSPDNFLTPYRQDFVNLQGSRLKPFNADKFFEATYFVLYFGGGWCSDCRQFSPELIRAYNNQRSADKQFEVLLLPRDKTEEGMIEYMKSERMKWPAFAFAKYQESHPLDEFYNGRGIPCVTVVDAKGTILFQSSSDKDAADVLKKLKELVRQ